MLGHDYIKRHNNVVRCIHLFLCNKFKIKCTKKITTPLCPKGGSKRVWKDTGGYKNKNWY